MNVVKNPAIPYWGHIPETVHPGTVIHVDGHVPDHAKDFAINLVTGHEMGDHASRHSTIAFHMDLRMHKDVIVLNSRQHKDWANEDRHSNHVHKGHSFSITIYVEADSYRIHVNGSHLCNFPHRIPFHEVKVLWIQGDVDVHTIEFRHDHHHHSQGVFVPSTFQPHGHHHHDHHHHQY